MIIAVIMVKNESNVLSRCLKSIIPHVDGIHIHDTGSDDIELHTMQAQVDIVCAGVLPVKWTFGSWHGFAASRNEALELAEAEFSLKPDDYLFMIDADDYVTHWAFTGGGMGGYTVVMESGGSNYERVQLFRMSAHWRYRGVVHEYPAWTVPGVQTAKADVRVASTREGARGRDPLRYVNDANMLAEALADPKTLDDIKPRYQFYLAQSWRDAGHRDLAADAYLKRIEMQGQDSHGWVEEAYVSYLELMRINVADHYGNEPEAVRAGMLKAQKLCPDRRECVLLMMGLYRRVEQWNEVIQLFEQFPPVPAKRGRLFEEANAYTYGMFDEVAIAFHYAGKPFHAVRANALALLKHPQSQGDIARIHTNLEFAVKALAERASDVGTTQPENHD